MVPSHLLAAAMGDRLASDSDQCGEPDGSGLRRPVGDRGHGRQRLAATGKGYRTCAPGFTQGGGTPCTVAADVIAILHVGHLTRSLWMLRLMLCLIDSLEHIQPSATEAETHHVVRTVLKILGD